MTIMGCCSFGLPFAFSAFFFFAFFFFFFCSSSPTSTALARNAISDDDARALLPLQMALSNLNGE